MYYSTHIVTIKFHFTLKHQLQGMDNVLQQTLICLILKGWYSLMHTHQGPETDIFSSNEKRVMLA